MGFTKKAIKQQEIIKNDYPELEKYYQNMMGNFSFTKNDVLLHINSILKWMKQFPEYQLMNESHDGFEEEFYLTDSFE